MQLWGLYDSMLPNERAFCEKDESSQSAAEIYRQPGHPREEDESRSPTDYSTRHVGIQ
jgi:hypothetical protein